MKMCGDYPEKSTTKNITHMDIYTHIGIGLHRLKHNHIYITQKTTTGNTTYTN